MSSDISAAGEIPAAPPAEARPAGRTARGLIWLAGAGIGAAIVIMVAASLVILGAAVGLVVLCWSGRWNPENPAGPLRGQTARSGEGDWAPDGPVHVGP